MKMTVMLDLDDTLLGGVLEHFMPAYLDALGQVFSPDDPHRSVNWVGKAIWQMMDNQDPSLTMEDVFDSVFYPLAGVSKHEMLDTIHHFYEHVHPTLRGYTHPLPGVQDFMAGLEQRGHDIVIATNPLFPRMATRQRLAWAGLPMEAHDFKLVSTYENFHFGKPNPAYYLEILAQLGWQEQPAVMIGDSLGNDAQPSSVLGLPFFLFRGGQPAQAGYKWPQGGYQEALDWIDEQSAHEHVPASLLAANIATLYATPAALLTTLQPYDTARCQQNPAPGEWSVQQVLLHLTEADADLNIPRIQQILVHANPFITDLHNDLANSGTELSLPATLQHFISGRKLLLSLLATITDKDWTRPARHSIFGPVDIAQMVDFVATHDRVHIRQIHKTLGLVQ